jgi:hypothetical protein
MILGTEKRTGFVVLINDTRVIYIRQKYVNNDINQAEDGIEVVLKEGGRKILLENISDIQSTTRTSRWVRVTRLDSGVAYLVFRDNIEQVVQNSDNTSTIEFLDSFSPWVVSEDTATINDSTGGGGSSDNFISNIEYVLVAGEWKLRATYNNGAVVDYDVPTEFTTERIAGSIRVSKNGDDAAALAAAVTVGGLTIYDWHTPFANPAVAMENAIAGQHSVIVEPGTYTVGTLASGADLEDNGSRYLVRDGVPLIGRRGAEIEYFSDSTTVDYVEDNGNPSEFIIRGNLVIRLSRSLDSSRGVDNDRTIVDWEFDKLFTAARFRWQVFQKLRLIGDVELTSNRGFLSTRDVTAFVPQTTRKTIILKGNSWQQNNFNGYDQIELAFLENSDVVLDYNKFNWISGSGGCIRFRSVRETTNVSVNLGSVNNFVNSGQPFLYLEQDDSRGEININSIDIAGRIILATGAFNPLTTSNKTIRVNGEVRDGNSGFRNAIAMNGVALKKITVDANLAVKDTVGNNANGGVFFLRDSTNVTLSGDVLYGNPNHTIVRLAPQSATPTVQGFIKNLVMTSTGCPSCIENSSATALPADLKVLSCASNVPVSNAAGVVNQLVQTVIIEPTV